MDGSDGAIVDTPVVCSQPRRIRRPVQQRRELARALRDDWSRILEQTDGRVTHFVAGLGTTGTFMGTGRRLRASRPGVELIAVEPDSLHGLEGLKHMATALVPGIYDASLATRHSTVATEDAHAMTRALARDAGLLVGPSSGAALVAAIELARTLDHGLIVTVFPDGGTRYLSEPLWDSDARTVAIPAEARAASFARTPKLSI